MGVGRARSRPQSGGVSHLTPRTRTSGEGRLPCAAGGVQLTSRRAALCRGDPVAEDTRKTETLKTGAWKACGD